jgi:hypothetical protein
MRMKPGITFLVSSHNGDATALAEVGRHRARDLGLRAEIVPSSVARTTGLATEQESIVAIVPVEFAAVQHEAWCLLCQLSLLRSGIGFTILVLGAEGSAEFQQRQQALLSTGTRSRRSSRRTAA